MLPGLGFIGVSYFIYLRNMNLLGSTTKNATHIALDVEAMPDLAQWFSQINHFAG